MALLAQLKNRISALKSENGKSDKTGGRHIADVIVEHNRGIAGIVLALVVVSILCIPFVGVNYDLTSYLPDYADSKKAINMMKDTFGYPGTGRIMLKDVSLYEAKQYKNQMEKVEGVDQIIWCDLVNQVYSSSDFIDYTAIDEYYKDNCAVMDVTFTEGDTSRLTHRAIDDIEEILGDRGYIVGMSPTNKFTEENVQGQMKMILAVAVTFIFLILLATTTSYFEPVLFLTVIGCAIAINKGTNLALGEISFVTNNIADVMQLATSMDYSVFLLHAYERERENGLDKEAAMKEGLKNTINTVLASSLTTFCGFIVLGMGPGNCHVEEYYLQSSHGHFPDAGPAAPVVRPHRPDQAQTLPAPVSPVFHRCEPAEPLCAGPGASDRSALLCGPGDEQFHVRTGCRRRRTRCFHL